MCREYSAFLTSIWFFFKRGLKLYSVKISMHYILSLKCWNLGRKVALEHKHSYLAHSGLWLWLHRLGIEASWWFKIHYKHMLFERKPFNFYYLLFNIRKEDFSPTLFSVLVFLWVPIIFLSLPSTSHLAPHHLSFFWKKKTHVPIFPSHKKLCIFIPNCHCGRGCSLGTGYPAVLQTWSFCIGG